MNENVVCGMIALDSFKLFHVIYIFKFAQWLAQNN